MDTPRTSRFDLSLIGDADRHNLSATFLEAVQRFFDDPANRKKFEQWQRERRQAPITAAGE